MIGRAAARSIVRADVSPSSCPQAQGLVLRGPSSLSAPCRKACPSCCPKSYCSRAPPLQGAGGPHRQHFLGCFLLSPVLPLGLMLRAHLALVQAPLSGTEITSPVALCSSLPRVRARHAGSRPDTYSVGFQRARTRSRVRYNHCALGEPDQGRRATGEDVPWSRGWDPGFQLAEIKGAWSDSGVPVRMSRKQGRKPGSDQI